MKRIILCLAAAAAVSGPVFATPGLALADDDRRGGRQYHRDRDDDDRRYRRGGGYRDDDRGRGRDRYDDERRRGSWDRGRHNGYYYNNRWYYGPPPEAYYGSPYYRPGYAAWRRGSNLPPYYRGYVVRDYERYRLRRPPAGYAWYRVGDDYLLAGIASGIIFDIIGED